MTKDKKHTTLQQVWEKLAGRPDDFSVQNRTINSLSIITLGMLLCILVVNIIAGLTISTYITWVLIVIQALIYYFSRIRRLFNYAIGAYAIFSYAALIINYRVNAGISGPTLFLFFLLFYVLLSITPQRWHLVWAIIHLLTVVALIAIEYVSPGWVTVGYGSTAERYMDVLGTYVLCLAFIYIITNYLLNRYNHEKRLADDRARAIQEHVTKIEEQNEKLKEIAWLQSHKVRNHVSTIMGLAQLFNEKEANDPANIEVIKGIVNTTEQLDDVIKNINKLTKKIEENP